ncbi:PEP-CTERM sorting domain-containing protein [Aliiglaciecola sp. 2_MG-2023]|uniref:PEP-CTERM sorting domain-containing protein n=1 Tax=unclassified Aliiglaciecola TaxID=2593648 RepID=UPI0026E38DEE|nr:MULTISPECIES: PEP-CTERM sorting domain-containing protein [unclassified Aliiglaciecola]MDO6709920.1 PEP-CTERM sorting domain-containing protein [Aliiglaciecola sp. 2_MG-2023]MDO6751068.1 PEP-CTERM sorting domain-containing protein [Aliiglaciecola sp. 1_MG-2023]
MKYLKKVLLATGLIATTLGMSLSANAGAIIQQDIYADVLLSEFHPFNIDLGPQVIGSVTYNTEDADGAGFLSVVELDLSIGDLVLTEADGDSADQGLPIIAGINPFAPNAGLEFLFETFPLFGSMPDYILTLDVGFLDGFLFVDEYVYDVSGDIIGVFPSVDADIFLGAVTYVPEPSALVLMLAGLGLLVRRKVAAK